MTKEKIATKSDIDMEEVASKQLPEPSGYRILCMVPKAEKKFTSGLIKSDITLANEEILATVLFVMRVGPDAYTDKTRFPNGPWCKEGDFVVVRPHAGSRLKIHGQEFRVINDDSIEAVVADPRGIYRA